MAVRIPIITVFDSKGLKQAQYQLNKVRGNFQNLGRNAAIAGVAIAGFATVLGKSVQNAAEAQRVMAQTEAVLKSTGTTANGSAQNIANLASSLQKKTAVDDEAIQSGMNLLLTFKSVQNQAGEGNDIFNQASATMLDFARATNTDASSAAIKLGKALQDPTRGITALRKSGVDFTTQQQEMIKSLVASGDLMGAQKIVLAELQAQFGGSAAAYAGTFAGQLDSLKNEMGDLSEEIGLIVIPALRELVTAFRDIAPEAGAKLKAALGEVDWAAFAQTIANAVTFFVQNADAILKLVGTVYALNTAYNVVKVTSGLIAAANVILGNTFTVTAGKIGLATGAVKLFRTALITTGIGALVVGLGFIIEAIINTNNAAKTGKPYVDNYGGAIRNSGADAEWAAARYGTATTAAKNYNAAVANIKPPRLNPRQADAAAGIFDTGVVAPIVPIIPDLPKIPSAPSSSGKTETISEVLQREGRLLTRQRTLQGFGLSEGLIDKILGEADTSKKIKAVYAQLGKSTSAATKLQAQFNKTIAGQAEINNKIAQDNARNLALQQEADRLRDELIAKEKAAADERARIYKSFSDSVTSTFANIKDAIVGSFSLPELGGSTDSIIRNMDKLLARVKSFSSNITKLSSMGLDPSLLAQVIQAGPVAGARLAAGLVAGGADALGRINTGFGEIQTLGSELGMTGTQARFNNATQQSVYNINVEGGVGSGATIGKAIVDAIKAYERTSGAVWQGA